MKTLWFLVTIATCTATHDGWPRFRQRPDGFIEIVENKISPKAKLHEHREYKGTFDSKDAIIGELRTHAPAELESNGYVAFEGTPYVIQSSTTIKLTRQVK